MNISAVEQMVEENRRLIGYLITQPFLAEHEKEYLDNLIATLKEFEFQKRQYEEGGGL